MKPMTPAVFVATSASVLALGLFCKNISLSNKVRELKSELSNLEAYQKAWIGQQSDERATNSVRLLVRASEAPLNVITPESMIQEILRRWPSLTNTLSPEWIELSIHPIGTTGGLGGAGGEGGIFGPGQPGQAGQSVYGPSR